MIRKNVTGDQPEILLDASSAILLHKVSLFPQLLSNYRAAVTASVYAELTQKGKTGSCYFTSLPKSALQIIDRQQTEQLDDDLCQVKKLDRGEHETILAHMAGNSKFIITDDKKAALFCKEKNIPFINALLVPRILFDSGGLSVNRLFSATTNLMEIGRYSPEIIEYCQKCPTAELTFFFPEQGTPGEIDWRIF
jgi:predicted nucleic acid-binding protein